MQCSLTKNWWKCVEKSRNMKKTNRLCQLQFSAIHSQPFLSYAQYPVSTNASTARNRLSIEANSIWCWKHYRLHPTQYFSLWTFSFSNKIIKAQWTQNNKKNILSSFFSIWFRCSPPFQLCMCVCVCTQYCSAFPSDFFSSYMKIKLNLLSNKQRSHCAYLLLPAQEE